MKSTRTIRTLNRCGIDPATIGFAGFTPTGKAVRRLAKGLRLERKVLALSGGGEAFNQARALKLSARQHNNFLRGVLAWHKAKLT